MEHTGETDNKNTPEAQKRAFGTTKEVKMNLLGTYQNGNYTVTIYDDGTKVRENDFDSFSADFPECMDVKITNQCDLNCAYCHEDSRNDGLHGDILNPVFIDSLKPFTEIAIGGGNPLAHPDLLRFLQKLKERKVIANITVNQRHFMQEKYAEIIGNMIAYDLVKGIGVSLSDSSDAAFVAKLQAIPNAVLHVINGILAKQDIINLSGKNLKMLILGYKMFRKGVLYHNPTIDTNKAILRELLPKMMPHFKVISFDNLAINQLEAKRLFSDKAWERFYMGDDGMFTMYIDLVKQEFARCSVADKRYPLMTDIIDMFTVIKSE